MFNKVTSRSYDYFFKFSCYFLLENWISPTMLKTEKFAQKYARNFKGYTCKTQLYFISCQIHDAICAWESNSETN
jgi:hypothetical protein